MEALNEIKVLDCSRWIAGPLCAMLLGDAGATVIKVEGLHGEDSRHTEPQIAGTSAYFHTYNRNKKSIAVDLRSADGREILNHLATSWADVIVVNFRRDINQKIGLTYEQLREKNKKVVVTAISGYGSEGPLHNDPCFNTIAEAFSGAMSLTGGATEPPTMSGYFAADHLTGLYATIGTLTALSGVRNTGVGTQVDIALTHAMFASLSFNATAALNGLPVSERSGNRDSSTAPADLFLTKDGEFIYLDAGTDALFAKLCQALNIPEVATDQRFESNAGRLSNWEALHSLLDETILYWPTLDLVKALRQHGIPAAKVNSVADAACSSEIVENKMALKLSTADTGQTVTVPGPVIRYGGVSSLNRANAGSPVGADTREILAGLCGYTDERIDELCGNSTVAQS